NTDKMGARATRATSPNPSVKGSRPWKALAAPTDTARVKVTVTGPVATPPESKAMEAYDGGAKTVRMKARAYPGTKMYIKGIPTSTLTISTATSRPTPRAIVTSSTVDGME